MQTQHPFELSTSPLYYSNDGRLRIDGNAIVGWALIDADTGETALFTHERLLVDAFIAGYDLATEAARVTRLKATFAPKAA